MKFEGSFERALDGNRLRLPRVWTYAAEESYILSAGNGNCLRIYSVEAFEKLKENFESATGKKGLLMLFSLVVELKLDYNNRITIPDYFRNYSGIRANGKVVLTGNGDYIELRSGEVT